MFVRFIVLALLLVSVPSVGSAADVLIIWDLQNANTSSLSSALQAAGHTVTMSTTDESGYTGSNPDPSPFGVVLHLNGDTYDTEMPLAGQNALVAYVQAGGGFIAHEWNAYQVDTQSEMGAMIDITPLERTSGDTTALTLSVVSAQASHAVLAGIPSAISVPSTGHNVGYARSYGVDPVTVLMTDNLGNDALVVREWGVGKIVMFHHSGNHSGSSILSTAGLQDVYVNAVTWAAGAATCDADGDGFDSLACGGGDCDDTDPTINPLAGELCDTIDQDCDGDIIESFLDTDGDNDPNCIDPDDDGDGDPDGSDCAPLDPTINSFGVESCNGGDDDCSGTVDDVDLDGDGWFGCGDDCDDTDASVSPGATEQDNGVDDDCDGQIDEGFGGDDDDATGDDDDATGDDDDATGDDDDATGDDDDATGDDDDATGDDDDAGDDDDGGSRGRSRRGCSIIDGATPTGSGLLLLAALSHRRRRRLR